jgi:hypothetical protein
VPLATEPTTLRYAQFEPVGNNPRICAANAGRNSGIYLAVAVGFEPTEAFTSHAFEVRHRGTETGHRAISTGTWA